MSNVFFDLGTHMGQGLSFFAANLNMNADWEIFSYEANPVTYNKFSLTTERKALAESLNVCFLNKAVYINDGTIQLHAELPPDEDETGMGSSVMSLNEWDPWGNTSKHYFKNSYNVGCVDFSNVVSKHIGKNIFCKMDIEGAEFLILEKMIKDNTLPLIQEIWIEFHDHLFTNHGEYSERKAHIIQYLKTNKIKYHLWH